MTVLVGALCVETVVTEPESVELPPLEPPQAASASAITVSTPAAAVRETLKPGLLPPAAT